MSAQKAQKLIDENDVSTYYPSFSRKLHCISSPLPSPLPITSCISPNCSLANALFLPSSPVVFSKSYCPYCRSTKQLLSSLDAKFTVFEMDQEPDGADLQDALEDISGQRTVPNVYIKQKHIGGNSDVQSLSSSGKLKELLKNAGALQE